MQVKVGDYLKIDGLIDQVKEILKEETYSYSMQNGLRFSNSSEIVTPDYFGITKHLQEWTDKGISFGRSDIKELEELYNIPHYSKQK